jgi:type II secretory pathway component PulF
MFFRQWAIRRFTRQLAMLVEEGLTFPDALELIRLQHRSRRWSQMLLHVKAQLGEGTPLSRALARTRFFPDSYSDSIRWAEEEGTFDAMLAALRLLADDTAPRVVRVRSSRPAVLLDDEEPEWLRR